MHCASLQTARNRGKEEKRRPKGNTQLRGSPSGAQVQPGAQRPVAPTGYKPWPCRALPGPGDSAAFCSTGFPGLGQILVLAAWLASLLVQVVGMLRSHLGFCTHVSPRGRVQAAGVVSYSTEHGSGDSWALGSTGKLTNSNWELVGRAGSCHVPARAVPLGCCPAQNSPRRVAPFPAPRLIQ